VLVKEHSKMADLFINSSFKVVSSLMSFWGIAWWTYMPNVAALRMLGECSTSFHLEMWSLAMPSLEDVPCRGMARRFLNILNRCVKKVYSKMISLLFVFCQLVAMQVWWMEACASMLRQYDFCRIGILHLPGQPSWPYASHLQEAKYRFKAMPCKPDATVWTALLSDFRIMVIWRWENVLLNGSLNQSLKMLQVMCCYRASMLLVAIGNSVRMLNSRGRKEVKKQCQVYAFVD
jgi:hypothetical protein